jgi:hypothetical protein
VNVRSLALPVTDRNENGRRLTDALAEDAALYRVSGRAVINFGE